jgi:exopolysaccharide production protein ExoQ
MRYVFAITAVLVMPFAIFMPKSLTPLFILTAIFALGLEFRALNAFEKVPKIFAVLTAISIMFFALSWLWSISPHETLRLILPIAGLFFLGITTVTSGLSLSISERQFVWRAIVLGSAVSFIILLIEIFSPLAIINFFYSIFKGFEIPIDYTYKNVFRSGANIAALIVFPAVAILWRNGKHSFAVGLMLLSVVTLSFSEAGSGFLALLIGLTAIALTYILGRYIRVFFSTALVICTLILPIVVSVLPSAGEIEERYPDLPNSVYPRIFIWQSSALFISQAPILGKGFNSSRAISKPEDRVEFSTKGNDQRGSVPIPLHPHSAILQIWLELGLVGIGLFLALLLTLIKRIDETIPSRSMRAMAYGSFFSTFTIANISYGIWQNWWVSALWLTTTFTIIAVCDEHTWTDDHDTTP